jgi:hypothetical protein
MDHKTALKCCDMKSAFPIPLLFALALCQSAVAQPSFPTIVVPAGGGIVTLQCPILMVGNQSALGQVAGGVSISGLPPVPYPLLIGPNSGGSPIGRMLEYECRAVVDGVNRIVEVTIQSCQQAASGGGCGVPDHKYLRGRHCSVEFGCNGGGPVRN